MSNKERIKMPGEIEVTEQEALADCEELRESYPQIREAFLSLWRQGFLYTTGEKVEGKYQWRMRDGLTEADLEGVTEDDLTVNEQERQEKLGVLQEVNQACHRVLAAKDMEEWGHAFLKLAIAVQKTEMLVLGGKVTDEEGNSYDIATFDEEKTQ